MRLRAKTEALLVTAAQNMGKYGFDHYRCCQPYCQSACIAPFDERVAHP